MEIKIVSYNHDLIQARQRRKRSLKFASFFVLSFMVLQLFSPFGSLLKMPNAHAIASDYWSTTSPTNAPSGRFYDTSVWAGSKMIVWGGIDASGNVLNTGGMYDPATDIWTSTSTTNAPAARYQLDSVWTGTKMIVWGGCGTSQFNTGGVLNPSTNTWVAMSTTNAPSARVGSSAVWTGTEMIVWGGYDSNGDTLNTGGAYNPSTDTWTALGTTNAPSGRYFQTAVWTGSEMIVWGGGTDASFFGLLAPYSSTTNTGGIYNPSNDTWSATSTTNAPAGRVGHNAIWTGTNMIIWGGIGSGALYNSGAQYNPSNDTWSAMSTVNAPEARAYSSAVWTGTKMIVWGGADVPSSSDNPTTFYNDGGTYNPSSDSWTAMATTGAPIARELATAVWTNNGMIIWGGTSFDENDNTTAYGDGGMYTPNTVTVAVSGVTVSPKTLNLKAGSTTGQLTADVTPVNATNKDVTWSSNHANIATVDSNGTITPVTVGTATITVTTQDGNFTDTATVVVADHDITSVNQPVTQGDVTISFLGSMPNSATWVDLTISSDGSNSNNSPTGKSFVAGYLVSANTNTGDLTNFGTGSTAQVTLADPTVKEGDTILYWDGSEWSSNGIANVSVDTTNGNISFDTTHFSQFAVFTNQSTVNSSSIITTASSNNSNNYPKTLPEAGSGSLGIFINLFLALVITIMLGLVSERKRKIAQYN